MNSWYDLGLRLHGRNWTAISQMVKTKTEAQCKNFYFNYKRKLDLENVIAEHNASKVKTIMIVVIIVKLN